MKTFGWLCLFGLVLFAVFAVLGGDDGAPNRRVADNQVLRTAEDRATYTSMIRSVGYGCPAAKLGYAEGPDAFGDVVTVHCGPAGRDGVYPNQTYKVTFLNAGGVRVEPIAYPY